MKAYAFLHLSDIKANHFSLAGSCFAGVGVLTVDEIVNHEKLVASIITSHIVR